MSRPNDSRMVVALGESYEKLGRLQEAKKCFWKAHSVGDMEGVATIKLARYSAFISISVFVVPTRKNAIYEPLCYLFIFMLAYPYICLLVCSTYRLNTSYTDGG